MNEHETETIGMLLDIEHLYGENQGRLGPWLISLCVAGAPVLLYVYTGLFQVIPIFIFAPIEIFFAIRVFMKIKGRENFRVEGYKKQLNDDYVSTADMLNIKTIHDDGCIEYLNGKISYLVCCFNGTCENVAHRSVQIRKMIDAMTTEYDCDIYIHNLTDSPALIDYYNHVNNFDKNQSATNFINIIDHTLELTEDYSLVQCTIYAIKGTRSDWKDMKNTIETTVNSRVAKAYKSIYRISDENVINDILNRNSDSVINVPDLLRRKYANQQYDSSKVLAYDLPDDQEIVQGQGARIVVVDDKAPTKSFHQKYEEIANVHDVNS